MQLTVIASDQRGFGPQVRATVDTFRINIGDVNDSIPTFTEPVGSLWHDTGSYVIKNNMPSPVHAQFGAELLYSEICHNITSDNLYVICSEKKMDHLGQKLISSNSQRSVQSNFLFLGLSENSCLFDYTFVVQSCSYEG